MKVKIIGFVLVLFGSLMTVSADTYEYPYDEMVISHTFTFDVVQDVSNEFESNFLNDIITVFNPYIVVKVAEFDLYTDGDMSIQDETIIIVSGVDGEIRYLQNSYSKRDIVEDEIVVGYTETYIFWNHKVLTDTEVVKDFDLDTLELIINYNSIEDEYTLSSNDTITGYNTTSSYILGSFREINDYFKIVFNSEGE